MPLFGLAAIVAASSKVWVRSKLLEQFVSLRVVVAISEVRASIGQESYGRRNDQLDFQVLLLWLVDKIFMRKLSAVFTGQVDGHYREDG